MLSLGSKPSNAAAAQTFRSELLPQLFLGYDQEVVPTNILDVGAGGSHTLDAFAFYRSKVHFLDLFALNIPEQGSSKRQEAYAHRAFSEALGDCRGVLFDLCLFWDLLTQLTNPALRGFNSALRPFLASPSQGYAVCQLFPDSEGKLPRYRIQDAQQLVQLPPAQTPEQSDARAPSNASVNPALNSSSGYDAGWSHTQFVEHFDCLRVSADRLQQDGRLELLFAAG